MSDLVLHPAATFGAPARTAIPAASMLRVMLGLFYLPHFAQKLASFDATVAFFAQAGLHPAPFFVAYAAVAELMVALALLLGVFTRCAALASCALMAVAAYAIVQVQGLAWNWTDGGIEYLAFWGLASLILFVDAERQEAGRG